MDPKAAARATAMARAAVRDDRRRASTSLVIMIVALLFQSLITGSHIHAGTLSGRAGDPGVSATASLGRHSPIKSGDCAICREIAQAGQYVGSAPPHFADGVFQRFWLSFPVVRAVARHSVSHAWHSRGPPPAAPL